MLHRAAIAADIVNSTRAFGLNVGEAVVVRSAARASAEAAAHTCEGTQTQFATMLLFVGLH